MREDGSPTFFPTEIGSLNLSSTRKIICEHVCIFKEHLKDMLGYFISNHVVSNHLHVFLSCDELEQKLAPQGA